MFALVAAAAAHVARHKLRDVVGVQGLDGSAGERDSGSVSASMRRQLLTRAACMQIVC